MAVRWGCITACVPGELTIYDGRISGGKPNLDVIKTADWVIDLGPEGGNGGGKVVAMGTPEEVAANGASWAGRYLSNVLQGR